MKASQFNLCTEDSDTGELLVFNTSSGSLIALPSERSDETRELLRSGSVCPSDASLDMIESLSSHGFLVDEDLDEVEQVLSRLQLGIQDTNRLDVFILPNMNCNFACPYCYEDHRPSQMSSEVEERIIRWFRRIAPMFKVVLVSWFGGEPLLSFDSLVRIQTQIRAICADAGTHCNAHITTNGYLLTQQRAAALVDAGVLSYQVTMDGPPEVHNRSRVLRGSGDSYDRVFSNLCSLVDIHPQTNVKLRVNFDPSTLPRVPELLRAFPSHLRPRLHVVLEKLFGEDQLFIGASPKRVALLTEQMYDVARDLGFAVTTTPLDPGKLTYCYADRENQFLFTHVGDVFKCTVSDFDSNDRLGYLDDDGTVTWEGNRRDEWMEVPAIDDECRSCTYLPMCMGGCRKVRHARGHASSDCTTPFEALEERVRSRYAQSRLDSAQR